MNPRAFIGFFRSRTGALLLFLILLLIAFFFFNGFKTPLGKLLANPESKPPDKGGRKSQVVETVTRNMTTFNPPKADLPAPTPTIIPEKKKQNNTPELPPISLYADSATSQKPDNALSDDYSPFGRLIQCELVITVDSSSISTPIIGLVTDDIWHQGRLIIPAGTEVHGSAKVDRVRERIASSGNWTLVWQTGEELNVSGLALDREKEPTAEGWGITDGSAGLRGQFLKSDDLAEIKLFTATFLSGAASGLTEKEQTLFGSQSVPSLQNAPLVGAQQVLNTYAKQILDTIQRDGFYVRVPAGKQFYLYVTQTMDKAKAIIGGTRLTDVKTPVPEENANDPLERLRKNLQRISVAPSTANASRSATASPSDNPSAIRP